MLSEFTAIIRVDSSILRRSTCKTETRFELKVYWISEARHATLTARLRREKQHRLNTDERGALTIVLRLCGLMNSENSRKKKTFFLLMDKWRCEEQREGVCERVCKCVWKKSKNSRFFFFFFCLMTRLPL